MILLVFLAIGLGVVLTTYEFSPKAHAWADDHARAIREAFDAHRAADAHLNNAGDAAMIAAQHAQAAAAVQHASDAMQRAATLPLPMPSQDLALAHEQAQANVASAGVDHAAAAAAANQAAAKSTAEAAKSAKTAAERAAAAQSAAVVLEREKKIAAALASLGVGQCGVRVYEHVTPQIKDTILTKLHGKGMTVTGDNPWDVDTGEYGVKLRALWEAKVQRLSLIVTDWGVVASVAGCDVVWGKINPILKEILGT